MPDFDFILLLPVFLLFQKKPQSKICGFLYYGKSACDTKSGTPDSYNENYHENYYENLKGEFLC